MHKIDEFKQGFDRVTRDPANRENPVELAKWLLDEGIDLYAEAFQQETGCSPNGSPDDQLVEQAFSEGLNDLRRKVRQGAFFTSNAALFSTVCTDISRIIQQSAAHEKAPTFALPHTGLLNKLVLDALSLLEEWASANAGVPGTFGIEKNWIHSAFQISHAVQQLYFGGSPFFAFQDNASESSIALVRVALESRIRFGFGVLGCTEKASGAFSPINMKTILDVLDGRQQSIKFSVPLYNIRRIYGWSNMYVHTGLRDYIWLPYHAALYLNSFFRGGKHRGGSSAFAGIVTSTRVIDAVQADVESRIDTTKLALWKIPSRKCEVVFENQSQQN